MCRGYSSSVCVAAAHFIRVSIYAYGYIRAHSKTSLLLAVAARAHSIFILFYFSAIASSLCVHSCCIFANTHTSLANATQYKNERRKKAKNNNTHSLSLIKDFSGRARKKTEKKPTVPSYCYSHTANLLCTRRRRRWNIFFLSRETLAIREKGRSEWTTTKREKKKQQEK